MAYSPTKTVLPFLLVAIWVCVLGCASSSVSVRFNVYRSPLLGLTGEGTIACLGFNGTDVALNHMASFLFDRALEYDQTLSNIEMGPVLRTLSRYPHEVGNLPDSLALLVGSELNAEVVLVGRLERTYIEEYGEEKVFRQEEVLGRTGIRLIQRAIVRSYIDQTATITATLRAYKVNPNSLTGNYTVTESDTYRTLLPELVASPPEGKKSVELVSPVLTEVVVRRVVNRLIASLVQEQITVTRWLFATTDPRAISAVREENWPRAGMIWKQIVAEDPSNAGAWNNLAIVHEQAGRRLDAEMAYRRALSAKPADKVIRFNSREYGLGVHGNSASEKDEIPR